VTETITEQHLIVSYRSCFTAPGSELALRDLAEFCRAAETTFDTDRDKMLVHEGRRQAFLRIQNFLNLTVEELTALRVGRMKRRPDNG
jgi:hypothetical protein